MARDKILGERDHLDHALVGLARGFAETDNAVFAEDEAVGRLCAFENFDGFFGEPKTRHLVGHDAEPIAKNFGAFFLAVWLIDHAQYRGGVRMVDEFMRQEGMEYHLDRRIGCRRIEEIAAFDADQLFIVDGGERAQLAHRRKPYRDHALGLDRGHVGARGFYAQDFDVVAKPVARFRFQRGVATAVQDEFWIAAEEPGRIDAQRQVAVDAGLGALRHHGLSIALDPARLHAYSPAKRRDHQPVLRGRSLAAASPVSTTTGSEPVPRMAPVSAALRPRSQRPARVRERSSGGAPARAREPAGARHRDRQQLP